MKGLIGIEASVLFKFDFMYGTKESLKLQSSHWRLESKARFLSNRSGTDCPRTLFAAPLEVFEWSLDLLPNLGTNEVKASHLIFSPLV